MAVTFTDAQRKLIDGKNFAYVAAIDADGKPQVTPVWIEYNGTHLCFNTAEGRAKTKHLRNNPNVAVCISNAENPYHYIEVRGKVAEITQEGSDEMIERLSQLYLGKPYPFRQPGEVRLVVKIEVEKVLGMGG